MSTTNYYCQIPLLLCFILCILSSKAFFTKSSLPQATHRNHALRAGEANERFKPPVSVAEMVRATISSHLYRRDTLSLPLSLVFLSFLVALKFSQMNSVGLALKALKLESTKRLVLVEVPLPVTGGTELDDWPGGKEQYFETFQGS